MKGSITGIRSFSGPSGYIRFKPLAALISIVVMAIILIGSIGIFVLIDDPLALNTEETSVDKGPLDIEIVSMPDVLKSGMMSEIDGIVADEHGYPVPQARVSIDLSEVGEGNFRTFTGDNGSFKLSFRSPDIDENSNITLSLTSEKNHFDAVTVPLKFRITTPENWTFMIYMSDCDLERWAIADINEMETITSGSHLNIVVQIDRWESKSPKDDRSNGNWTTARRYLIKHDDDPLAIGSRELMDLGEINSADPEELVKFTEWSMKEYPADRYALILWDHGSGIDGVCWDQTDTEDDLITIKELSQALDIITDKGSSPLDIMGFDACLMSTIEVAYEIAPYARYMVSSEITEPNYGWDYGALQELLDNPFLSTMEISKILVGRYIDQTRDVSTVRSLSLGLFDLSVTVDVVSNLNTLSNTINDAGSTEIYNMRIARKYAQPISEGHSSDAVDLMDYIQKIMNLTDNDNVKEDAQVLIDSLMSMTILFEKVQGMSDIDTGGLNGLSIYSPDFREVLDSSSSYDDLKFTSDTSWKDTLLRYYDSMEQDMKNKAVYFDKINQSLNMQDMNGDLLPDTMIYRLSILSDKDDLDVFLGINVYDLRGNYVNSTQMTFNINKSVPRNFDVRFQPTGEYRESGLYRMVAYLCLGKRFDPLSLQDYTRSGYRWVEVS